MTEVIARLTIEKNRCAEGMAAFEAEFNKPTIETTFIASIVQRLAKGKYTPDEIEQASFAYYGTIDPDQNHPAKDYHGIPRFNIVMDEMTSHITEQDNASGANDRIARAGGLALQALRIQFPETYI